MYDYYARSAERKATIDAFNKIWFFWNIKSWPSTLQLSTRHEFKPTHILQYRFSCLMINKGSFQYVSSSKCVQVKGRPSENLQNEFRSLKGQAGSVSVFQRKAKWKGKRKFDYDIHITIKHKGEKKDCTNDLKAFYPLGWTLTAKSKRGLRSSDIKCCSWQVVWKDSSYGIRREAEVNNSGESC